MGNVFLVAERDGEVVGRSPAGPRAAWIGAWLRRMLMTISDLHRPRRPPPSSPARFDGWGIIASLYVVENERQRCLATHLVEAIREEPAAIGASRIQISVMAADEPAIGFWSSQGFGRFAFT